MIAFWLEPIFIRNPFNIELLSISCIRKRSTGNSSSVFSGELFLLTYGFYFGAIISFEANR